MTVKAMNKVTGELFQFPCNTPEDIVTAWLAASEQEKAAKALKDQLKPIAMKFQADEYEHTGYKFRESNVQRMNYDKAVLRQVIQDEDTLDMFLVPDKPAIDKYLKENLEILGDASHTLRSSMIEVGKSYQVIKLERLK